MNEPIPQLSGFQPRGDVFDNAESLRAVEDFDLAARLFGERAEPARQQFDKGNPLSPREKRRNSSIL